MDLIRDIDDLIGSSGNDLADAEALIDLGRNSRALSGPLLSRRAAVALQRQDFQAGLAFALAATHRYPTDATAHMLLAIVLNEAGAFNRAVGAMERAVKLAPDNMEHQLYYVQALARFRKPIAKNVVRQIARYVTSDSVEAFVTTAQNLSVAIEGGAWMDEGKITIWIPNTTGGAYAKVRLIWRTSCGWSEKVIELKGPLAGAVCSTIVDWPDGALICTVKMARNGAVLSGCPLFHQDPMPLPDSGEAGELPVVKIIIPVFKGLVETRACIASVLSVDAGADFRVIIVLDSPTQKAMRTAISEFLQDPRVTLISNPENIGFTASINLGLAEDFTCDTVILNADTVVPEGWLGRLRAAAYSATDIGTVTPLSNNGEIVSFPSRTSQNPLPTGVSLSQVDAAAQRVNGGVIVDLPTGVGFCMFIKRATLADVGALDAAVFGMGYGEETDFCLRAQKMGWRSVCAAEVFVQHISQVSFGEDKEALVRLNMRKVSARHPEYNALIGDFLKAAPLAPALCRLERALLCERPASARKLVIGPQANDAQAAVAAMRYQAASSGEVILWCTVDPADSNRVLLHSEVSGDCQALSYSLTDERDILFEDLQKLSVQEIFWYGLVHDDETDLRLLAFDVPQHFVLCSCDLVHFLQSDSKTARAIAQACDAVHVASTFGYTVAQNAQSQRIFSNDLLELSAISEPLQMPQATDGISIAVVEADRCLRGLEKLQILARHVNAAGLPIKFYLFDPTLDDLSLQRTDVVFPLGAVAEDDREPFMRLLGCNAGMSISLQDDPVPFALAKMASHGLPVFCFPGAARNDVAKAAAQLIVLDQHASAKDWVAQISASFTANPDQVAWDA